MRVLIKRGGCPPGGWEAGKRVSLDDGEVHHLRVRRARDRETVEVLDGAGLKASGQLIQDGRQWLVELGPVERQEAPPELIIAVGAGDRERFSWLVEKAVELGVTRIVPLETAHIIGVATRLKQSHLPRLRRSVLDVLKQCGSAWAPTIAEPIALEDFLERPPEGAGWLADSSGAPLPAEVDSSPLTIVIGPEGGFTESERMEILEAGYSPVGLGPHTLRFETAALAAAAVASQARLRRSHA
jgi:16S rRNA (uracil1498-N3)-methyltransferase